jgi:hypothetical protein
VHNFNASMGDYRVLKIFGELFVISFFSVSRLKSSQVIYFFMNFVTDESAPGKVYQCVYRNDLILEVQYVLKYHMISTILRQSMVESLVVCLFPRGSIIFKYVCQGICQWRTQLHNVGCT